MSEWISVEDRLPPYGEPVILSIKNVVQHVTYMLDGADETPDWFEPYFFDADDNTKLWWNKADYWQLLPAPPEDKTMKVKTQHVPEGCDYLTNGKEYEATKHKQVKGAFIITDDEGEGIVIRLDSCLFLNGHSWEVIPEENV